MSHTCPDCGQCCNCCGDIDDCALDTFDSYVNCCHCGDEIDSDDDYVEISRDANREMGIDESLLDEDWGNK